MKKTTFLTLIFSLIGVMVIAQKKKDLLLEIEALKSKLSETQANLETSQRNEKVSEIKLTTLREQNSNLKNTNTSLLQNISLLTETSKKESENVRKTLESLKQKENQIKSIRDALTQRDSVKLALLTQLKTQLGDSTSVNLSNETIIISIPNTLLFENTDQNFEVDDDKKIVLEKLANVLTNNPEIKIIVQGNSNALKFEDKTLIDNWDLSARQAASIVRVLQEDYQIDPKRMDAMGKSEYATEGVDTFTRIIINSNLNTFYELLREQMKSEI